MGDVKASTERAAMLPRARTVEVAPRDRARIPVEAGEACDPLELLAERAVYWPGTQTLLVADMHLGKSETFRAAGAPIPDGAHAADLTRLGSALDQSGAKRLIVLGDLLHAGIGVTGRLIDEVAAWRAGRPALEILVVPGNHDRRLDLVAEAWSLTVTGAVHEESGVEFRHDPAGRGTQFCWCGHVHPLVRVGGSRNGMILPCFWLGRGFLMLPSFGSFTRGAVINPESGDRVFAIGGGDLFEV